MNFPELLGSAFFLAFLFSFLGNPEFPGIFRHFFGEGFWDPRIAFSAEDEVDMSGSGENRVICLRLRFVIRIADRKSPVSTTLEKKHSVVTQCTGNQHCDSNGDLNRGSNHRSRDLKVRFELPEAAIWGDFLRFGLLDLKSLAICNLWCGALITGR